MRKAQGLTVSNVSMHMIFTGNPGTGKTTIARLVSKYLKAIGVLSGGQLVEVSRADLEAEWKETVASATAAAKDGSIDDVIDAAELRQRICAAVYMLMMKSEGTPSRKHCNLPL